MTFSTKAQLEKKTGPWGLGRFKYLQALVTEYQDTHKQGKSTRIFLDSKLSVNFPCMPSDHKLQVLANLANFAYDPINYEYFRQLNILDLFLGE